MINGGAGTIEDVDAPGLTLVVAERIKLAELIASGLGAEVKLDQPGQLQLALRTFELTELTPGDRGSSPRPHVTTLATVSTLVGAGGSEHSLNLSEGLAPELEAKLVETKVIRARLIAQTRTPDGLNLVANRGLVLSR